MRKHLLAILMTGLCWHPASQAAEGIAFEAGQGNDTDMGRLSLISQWDDKWFADGDWYLTGYWEASLGRWKSSNPGGKGIWELGITPVFRLKPKATSGLRPYLEAAVGAHLISRNRVDDDRDMGCAFQFGEHAGAGITFGDKGQYELGYRIQHLSNADIKKPNDGINFQQIRFVYLF